MPESSSPIERVSYDTALKLISHIVFSRDFVLVYCIYVILLYTFTPVFAM